MSRLAERRVTLAAGQILVLALERRRSGDVVRALVELTRADGYPGGTAGFDLPTRRLRAVAQGLEELAAEIEAGRGTGEPAGRAP